MTIKIYKSETADTRTCDWSKVTEAQLLESSMQHIKDVQYGLRFFSNMLSNAGHNHDHTKVSNISQFHADFQTGFKQQIWHEIHKSVERHHMNVPEGVRDDVNLVDVIEHIVDCVMAGIARSGQVYELKLSDELLQKAFKNTVELLKNNVELVKE